LVDRAFIDASFWDKKEKKHSVTMINRMKKSIVVLSSEDLPVEEDNFNERIISDQKIRLKSTRQDWRLITYRTRRGKVVQFLTNDFTLEPGLIAFLYSRRWDEEKCFDTWKNDFSQAKAGVSRKTAIQNQVLLFIITNNFVAMLVQ